MNVRGITVAGTVLPAMKFCNFFCTRHNVTNPSQTSILTALAVAHPLIYVMYLAAAKEAWSLHVTKKCVTKSYTLPDEPSPQKLCFSKTLIHKGLNRSERQIHQGSEKLETWGDVMIWGLWDQQTDAFINVRLGNADAYYYRFEPMAELLTQWNKVKKNKNGNHCHNQRKKSSLFFRSINGLLGRQALVVLANLSQLMQEKWANQFHTCKFG